MVGDQIPRTMMRPLVNATSSRNYIILSQPRPFHCTAMKLGQMLRSLRSFLSRFVLFASQRNREGFRLRQVFQLDTSNSPKQIWQRANI